jgi:hypothetical protein
MNKHPERPPQPTRALTQFEALIGEWDTAGTHPLVAGAIQGHSSFEWLKEGALLLWHFNWESAIPNAISVIGHDDTLEPCTMLYADERGVARIYQMSLDEGVWKMWRESAGFSQRMTGTFSADGNTIAVRGELARDGSTWERDLDVTYRRSR